MPLQVATEFSKNLGSPLYISEPTNTGDFVGENRNLLKKAVQLISNDFVVKDDVFIDVYDNYHLPCRLEFLKPD